MNEKIKSVVTTVKTKWTDASKMAKILVISIPIVVIAIIIVLCIILNNTGKNTAVLFNGRELDDDALLRDCGIKNNSTVTYAARAARNQFSLPWERSPLCSYSRIILE